MNTASSHQNLREGCLGRRGCRGVASAGPSRTRVHTPALCLCLLFNKQEREPQKPRSSGPLALGWGSGRGGMQAPGLLAWEGHGLGNPAKEDVGAGGQGGRRTQGSSERKWERPPWVAAERPRNKGKDLEGEDMGSIVCDPEMKVTVSLCYLE